MKKYIVLLFLSVSLGLSAQSTYEAVRLFDSELSGTARFVGMGGAMSALGGDLSVMSTNPAGTAVYRTGDVSLSANVSFLDISSKYNGNSVESSKTNVTVDNIGMVFVNNIDDGALKFVNFGINYKQRKNLSREFSMMGFSNGFSQMFQMRDMYDAAPFDVNNMYYTDYTSLQHSWLALLAADGLLLTKYGDKDVDLSVFPDDMHSQIYDSEESGGIDEIDINFSLNIDDRLYLGATLSTHHVDYGRYSYYGEDDSYGEIYTLQNWYDTRGEGFDFKLGLIWRPIYESSLKLAFAVHSPTWYNLTDCMSSAISGLTDEYGVPYFMDTQSADAYGDNYYLDYKLTTPWRFNVAGSYILGGSVALDAEYEYADYSTANIKVGNGIRSMGMDSEFDSNMRAVHTFRAGAEWMLDKNLSLRCGYNHITAPFKKDAAKFMLSSVDTNTEYLNRFDTNTFTMGIGYRKGMFYIDAAYMLSMQSCDFYPYYDAEFEDIAPSAKVDEMKNKFVVSAGLRF